MHVCMYVCVLCMYVCIMYVCMYVCMQYMTTATVHYGIRLYRQIHLCQQQDLSVCMYVCLHVCMYVVLCVVENVSRRNEDFQTILMHDAFNDYLTTTQNPISAQTPQVRMYVCQYFFFFLCTRFALCVCMYVCVCMYASAFEILSILGMYCMYVCI